MAKGQKRSTREKKKPKTALKKMAAAPSARPAVIFNPDRGASKRPQR